MAAKTITQQELINKVLDIDISDEELAKYFVIDEDASEAFAPKVVPNPEMVEDNGLEGAFLLNAFNGLARARRNRKYRRRIKKWTGVKIVAEGDSWFQYPLLLKDTIDQLIDLDKFQYAIYGLSEAGDLLSNIVKEDEITEAIEKENPDVFLISGGGNDMVGDNRMATLVHEFDANRLPKNYPNDKFDLFLRELETLYRGLFTRLLADRPHLKILCHGYDNAIPQDGKWLGKPLKKRNISDKDLQREIVAVMIGRFNERLKEISDDFPGSVYHVDCQKIVGPKSNWQDELHPKNEGYLKVAKKFDEVIKLALAEDAPSVAIPLRAIAPDAPETKGKVPVTLPKLSKLDNQDFLNLVVKRAEAVMGKEVAVPKTRYERKQLEKDISEHFEKIHKEINFLPSSFLEKGVIRSKSVCRITTDSHYGSGFLIGSRNFIMTNNHVIPDTQTAESSQAEFDYDEDDILYAVSLEPDRFFITNKDLDFTIVACNPDPLPADIKAIELLRDPDTITRGERANIIQHPQGRKKEISLHDNKVNYVYDVSIRYTADTEGGSSGSPVFNNEWNLVALHHAGWSEADGSATNEGMRMKAIVDFLLTENDNESSAMLESLVQHITDAKHVSDSHGRTRHTPSPSTPTNMKRGKGNSVTLNLNGDVNQITINFD
ncbi:trypsin-like peptidase domain-containing protein [Rhodohalobacter sulfatireducens]|uniref:Serine protease n=1 Tax=Rhodohalobacter sulfatireducens TaxID=2911366 RepID=A0ABS9KI89_9BACT|nr:trypsin-like peptidase domain-containing protein [Rhodohalobacter sulfatireducens]MCG2590563.1 trypsin-like peptidase domain-containing protein [Rhodohalobacter sulfatireducens]